jgi:hypothetical protein
MKIRDMDFLDYLGLEERNLLASIVNFRQEFDIFYNIDKIYRAPLSRLSVSENEAVIPQLYLFVHFYLYFAVTCILRSHLSEALSTTRKAIDGAFTAYALILEPDKAHAYLERDKYFLFIKANIQRHIEKDTSAFPFARELLNIHDACSEFGSHADISSFFSQTGDYAGSGQDEYRFYFLVILQAFFLIFRIFRLFFEKKLGIIEPTWEAAIAKLGPLLDKSRQAAYERLKTIPNTALHADAANSARR